MVDYTTTAKWGEAPTPPYSHIYIDTYNLIQHTPTKSSPHTVSLPQCSCLKSHHHFTYCSVLSRAMVSSFMCVYMCFFCFFFHHPHCRDNAWSMEFKFRERQRHTHTEKEDIANSPAGTEQEEWQTKSSRLSKPAHWTFSKWCSKYYVTC